MKGWFFVFGEREILKNIDVKIDNKNRIIIPSICRAESTDCLVIFSKKEYIEIWNLEDVKKYLQLLREKSGDPFYCSDFLTAHIEDSEVRIDVAKRVNLGAKLVKEYHLENEAHIEGKGKYIRIWNIENFKRYKENLEEPKSLKK